MLKNGPTAVFFIYFICILLSCSPKYSNEIKSLNDNPPKPQIETPSIQVVKTVYIDAAFTQNQRRNIRDALWIWERVSHGRVRFHTIYDFEITEPLEDIKNKIVIVHLGELGGLTKQFDENLGKPFLAGFVKLPDAELIILCPERQYEFDFYKQVQRMVGKELGLKDVDDGGIMNESQPPGTTCPNQTDMTEFCRVFLCDIEEVGSCK